MYCCSVCMAYYFVYVHLLDHFLEIHWNKIIVFCRFIASLEQNYCFLWIHRYPFIATFLEPIYRYLFWNFVRTKFSFFADSDSSLPIHLYPFVDLPSVFGYFVPFFGKFLEGNYCFLQIPPIGCKEIIVFG